MGDNSGKGLHLYIHTSIHSSISYVSTFFKDKIYSLQMKKEELIQEMERSTEDLIGEIEQLSEKEFETTLITGTWTAKDILSHVAAWDIIFVDLSKTLLRGEPLPALPDFDAINAEVVSERRNLSRSQITEEVRKNRKAYTDFIAALTEEQLTEPGGDNHTINGLAENIISHDRHHLWQIRIRKG